MGLCGVTNEIKENFGKRLRAARDAKGLSRQVLSARLGVSPKTVQSWEMGRTFIEKLSLFPLIERELGISLSEIIEEAMFHKTGKKASEKKAKYGKTEIVSNVSDTTPVTFQLNNVRTNTELNPEIDENYYAIPIVNSSSISTPVFDLKESDVVDHTIIDKDWVPRGGVMIGCTIDDNGLEPTIPADSLLIIDRRELELDKSIGRNIAIFQKGKGLKLRQLEEGTKPGTYRAVTVGGKSRGSFEIKPDKGDIILGRIVAVFSKC